MTDLPGKPRGDIGWGIPASILVHVVFVAALFFHLPVDQSEPEREESVQVEIVPPPEEQKAEEKKPTEEAKPEEKKPPEPAKQEEAKKAEPPPAAPEEKPAEPPPSAEQAKGQPLPVLRPVFEFGEKDGGPKKSETGNASKETTTPPAESKADAQAVEPVKQAKEAPTVVEAPPANPVPDDIQLPEVGIAAANGLQNAPVAGTSPDATKTEIVTAPPAASPKSDPSKTPTGAKPVELTEAKTLFSQSETDDPVATTAMRNVPRGVRAGQLCATELREQLRHSAQAYRPEMLPAYRLPSGTVLEVKRGAFRANAQWYDLSFRCEVDDDATKIVSFAFDIGAPVPQSEWRRRGFPEL
ncbi:DUF930 domain-containing protein [Neorhizobium galegae]|uniref:DUF930 domain-containing protein n=1 Tax=Neorhizobium galegae TaxID=399 RepID=UPI000621596A|nr:DUF930 domain-containing protein [Neorhizobium galegae]CDZ25386.1 Mll3619 protein [Neorhizobium galegae bv. officinalis]KAA9387756.1 DUF930 domain-containing protein [Neorhizobium galegae]KAB1115774.1 DUF930 domain-containing protein [Neorhizobium galegae]MCM2498329.1 DUF930 domain-containing protein [Neorhizobium galegae]MCQ1774298.1 DUF930 domain-containing protein [Neorhizobium galegae]